VSPSPGTSGLALRVAVSEPATELRYAVGRALHPSVCEDAERQRRETRHHEAHVALMILIRADRSVWRGPRIGRLPDQVVMPACTFL
jgi:hypothetical protein